MVSEPPEDNQEAECEDVGVAFVSVRDILHQHRDIKDEDIKGRALTGRKLSSHPLSSFS